MKVTRKRQIRRDRRKAKESGWTRMPPVAGKVGHGGRGGGHVEVSGAMERATKPKNKKKRKVPRSLYRDALREI